VVVTPPHSNRKIGKPKPMCYIHIPNNIKSKFSSIDFSKLTVVFKKGYKSLNTSIEVKELSFHWRIIPETFVSMHGRLFDCPTVKLYSKSGVVSEYIITIDATASVFVLL
jgi:hypothetical protein